MVSSNQTGNDTSHSSEIKDSAGDVTAENSLDNSDGMSPINALSHSLSDIRAMQNADLDIKTVLSWLAHAQRPSRIKIQRASCLQRVLTEVLN